MIPHRFLAGFSLCHLAVFVFVLALVGCRPLGGDSLAGRTAHDLEVLGRAAEGLAQRGHNITSFVSVHDLVAEAIAAGLLDPDPNREADQDRWGRPLKWRLTKNPDGTSLIRISSEGNRAGGPKDSQDDIYLDINVLPNGRVTTKLVTPH